jgi:hypothetical protein
MDLTSVVEGVLTAKARSDGEVTLDDDLQNEGELWGV